MARSLRAASTSTLSLGTFVLVPSLVARANAPAGRYDLTVDSATDNETGLVWQRRARTSATSCAGEISGECTLLATTCGTDATCTPAEATAYCDGLQLGGASTWRLPSLAELVSLIDVTRYDPAVDPIAFADTPAEFFWTSSPYVGPPADYTWRVSFQVGTSSVAANTQAARVRCVR